MRLIFSLFLLACFASACNPSPSIAGSFSLSWEASQAEQANYREVITQRLNMLRIEAADYELNIQSKSIQVTFLENIDSTYFDWMPILLTCDGQLHIKEVFPFEQSKSIFQEINKSMVNPADTIREAPENVKKSDDSLTSLSDIYAQEEAEKHGLAQTLLIEAAKNPLFQVIHEVESFGSDSLSGETIVTGASFKTYAIWRDSLLGLLEPNAIYQQEACQIFFETQHNYNLTASHSARPSYIVPVQNAPEEEKGYPIPNYLVTYVVPHLLTLSLGKKEPLGTFSSASFSVERAESLVTGNFLARLTPSLEMAEEMMAIVAKKPHLKRVFVMGNQVLFFMDIGKSWETIEYMPYLAKEFDVIEAILGSPPLAVSPQMMR